MGISTHQHLPDATSPRGDGHTDGPGLEGRLGDGTQAIFAPSRARSSAGPDGRKGPPKLPKPGDELFGFRLRHELGRGAFARVFLAEQAHLAGRPVVLKISSIAGNEPQTLAQLQHTSIVPIHSVHEDPEQGLRAVCMPYFGGAALSEVVRALFAESLRPQHGAELVKALVAVRSPAVVPSTAVQPAENAPPADGDVLPQLSGQSYLRATVWLVAQLADAVQHAHRRGVLHRDIKPSNVLLCGDGQPMLLDFNIAQNVNSIQAQAKVVLGGTVAYMAPEQLRALAERSPALALQVDHRADLYSLGMVLYEMIAGHSPFDLTGSYAPAATQLQVMAKERAANRPSMRSHRPDVPWSLESIVRKCLAPDPTDRYQKGEELAEDLRRFLDDRPLKYAPELSWRERSQKWLRRHPRLTSAALVAGVAGLLLVGVGAALVMVRRHLADTRQELHGAQAQDRKRAYEQGAMRALCLVNTVVDARGHLDEGLKVCAETLNLYGVLDRDDWQAHPDWQHLSADDRRRLAEDARELLLLLAGGRVRKAPDDPAVLRAALALLDRAEAVPDLGPSRALLEARADYLAKLGDPAASEAARAQARALKPDSAREHYLLATAYVRGARTRQDYQRAIDVLSEAIRLDGRYYWAYVQRGICHYERGDLTAAAADFGVCVGQWPEFAWGYYNLGYVLARAGNRAGALDEYARALEHDPSFVLVHVSRGLLYLEQKRYAEALADLDRAWARGQNDAALHAGRGAALEGLRRTDEADAAFAAALDRLSAAAPEVRTHVRLLYGFTVAARRPDEARAAFAAVPGNDRRSAEALYGLALVDTEEGRLAEALRHFDRALEVHPGFVEARRFRAVLRARSGNFDGAGEDVNWCLEREPHVGATLYAAACVAARALERTADPAAGRQALFFLEKALELGYGQDKAAQDADLAALRRLPEFWRLLKIPPPE